MFTVVILDFTFYEKYIEEKGAGVISPRSCNIANPVTLPHNPTFLITKLYFMQPNKNIVSLAVNKEEHVIRREFTPEELTCKKEEFAQNAIVFSRLENELSEVKKGFKERMDPVKSEGKRILADIKAGFEDVKMEVLLVPNEDKRIMEFYDNGGTCVGSRPMTFEERKYHTELDRLPQTSNQF